VDIREIMGTKKSQIAMLEHSKAKIKLLEKYLDKFLNIISNDKATSKINIFDLFCGEGVYENNGEGSPIAILRVLKSLHYINKAKNKAIPPIDVFFNDNDEFKIEKLKSIISERKLHTSAFGKMTYSTRNYKEIVDGLATYINNFKKEKAFVFIDPYGYKEIRASEIKKLLVSKKSEVLLFLPTQFMYRFDEKGTPQALIEILEELVDMKDWKPSTSVYEFIEKFKNALKEYIGQEFFVDTFTIQKDEQTVYCLFFFSSHIRGFEKMLETKWQIDEESGKGWKYTGMNTLFSILKTNPLEEILRNYLSRNEKVYNGDIYQVVLRAGFLPKHSVEVLGNLQNKGQLDVISDTSEKVRKGAFYISYDNYRDFYKKVYFKLK